MNEAQLNVRLPNELKSQIERIAKEEHRSVNNLVNLILEQFVAHRED